MGRIYLIRHGQASVGAGNDDRLSPLGREQTRQLGLSFNQCGRPVGQIVTGTMTRHWQTAEVFLETLALDLRPKLPIRMDSGFDEYDRADLLMRAATLPTADQTDANAAAIAFVRWVGGRHDSEYRESWPSFQHRCVAALDRLGPDDATVVFTSAGAISAVGRHLLGIPRRRVIGLASVLVNTGITTLLAGYEELALQTFNSFDHLHGTRSSGMITLR